MFTQYFGNYLFESGIITLEQFKDALQQIHQKRAMLGVLALEAGFMTALQVENTHNIQRWEDKKFGEIAVENGYITNEQLDHLLSRQSSPFSVFSQLMLDQDYMSYSQLSGHIEGYRRKCGMDEVSFTRFKNGDIRPLIENIYDSQLQGEREIFVHYIELFMKNILRFIDDDLNLEKIENVILEPGDLLSCQKVTGSMNYFTAFSGNEAAMLSFSCRFAKKEIDGRNAIAHDILGEFLNCNNGIFISNMIEYGLDLDLEPQYLADAAELELFENVLSIPFSIENNNYQLHLAVL